MPRFARAPIGIEPVRISTTGGARAGVDHIFDLASEGIPPARCIADQRFSG